MVLLDYSEKAKGYRLWDPSKILESRDVVFDETNFSRNPPTQTIKLDLDQMILDKPTPIQPQLQPTAVPSQLAPITPSIQQPAPLTTIQVPATTKLTDIP